MDEDLKIFIPDASSSRSNSRDDLSVTSETPFLTLSPENEPMAYRNLGRRVPRVYSLDPFLLQGTHIAMERNISAPMLHVKSSKEGIFDVVKKVGDFLGLYLIFNFYAIF